MDVNVINASIISAKKDHLLASTDNKVDSPEKNQSNQKVPLGDEPVSKVDADELQQAVKDIAASMNLMQKGLAFNIDEDSGVQVVKVIDEQTGDLIRQIPNEEALDIAKKLSEVTGLLMKTEV